MGITNRFATEDYVITEMADSIKEAFRSQEPIEGDIPRVYFGLSLPQTKDEVIMSFRYVSRTQDIKGYCKTKAQGNSSMSYPKKNQTVKLYKDVDCTEKLKVNFKGWGEQHKFCLKANWIDLTHARNIVSARLWGKVAESRENYESIPELLLNSPNKGVVDGFPIRVYAEGVYQGRYTLNIPKDAWMAGMDDGLDEHCILCGENYESGCFRAEAAIDGTDWTDEIHDEVPDAIKTRWNEAIRFVMNSTDEEFISGIGNYFDLESLIDYYIFGVVSCGLDAFGKNQLYMTYDGQKWYAQMYDMDSTWGLWWDGSSFVGYDYDRSQFEDFNGRSGNLLYSRVEALFAEPIKQRWELLKNDVLSVSSIIDEFERFVDIVPPYLVEEDYASTTAMGSFTGIPSRTTNNIQQIREYVYKRLEWLDKEESGDSVIDGNVLYSNYSPNGVAFKDEASIDWDTQYIEASIDLSGTPSNSAARIVLSAGQDITVWPGISCLHLYYHISTPELRVQFFDANGDFAYLQIPFEDTKLLIRLDKNGLALNGTYLTTSDYGDQLSKYEAAMTQILALDKIDIGAVEGTYKSYATYDYIAVRDL